MWTGGVFNADAVGGLALNETTMADILKEEGYQTAAVGKWHLGQQHQYLPTSRGFDHYLGIPYSVDMGSSPWKKYTSVDRPPLPLVHNTTVIEQPTDLNKLSDRYVDFASEFIKSNSAAGHKWFLYLAWNHVHVPDFATKAFCNTSDRGRFGDALKEMDHSIGRVLAAVNEAGVEDDTIVFFTSDNGPWLSQLVHGGSAGLLKDGKTTTWEGGVREPGIVKWPGKIRPGRTSHAVVATYDIFATAVTLAGGKIPSDRAIDGKDLSAILFAEESKSPHECIFHYKGTPGMGCPADHPDCPGLWAVRCGLFKMHYVTSHWETGSTNGKFHDPPLIYHIEHDPSEKYPLDPKSQDYAGAHQDITAAVAVHNAGLVPGKMAPSEMLKGDDPSLKLCCSNASSTGVDGAKYPNCTCNPENWDPSLVACDPLGTPRRPFERAEHYDERDASTWPKQPSLRFQDS